MSKKDKRKIRGPYYKDTEIIENPKYSQIISHLAAGNFKRKTLDIMNISDRTFFNRLSDLEKKGLVIKTEGTKPIIYNLNWEELFHLFNIGLHKFFLKKRKFYKQVIKNIEKTSEELGAKWDKREYEKYILSDDIDVEKLAGVNKIKDLNNLSENSLVLLEEINYFIFRLDKFLESDRLSKLMHPFTKHGAFLIACFKRAFSGLILINDYCIDDETIGMIYPRNMHPIEGLQFENSEKNALIWSESTYHLMVSMLESILNYINLYDDDDYKKILFKQFEITDSDLFYIKNSIDEILEFILNDFNSIFIIRKRFINQLEEFIGEYNKGNFEIYKPKEEKKNEKPTKKPS